MSKPQIISNIIARAATLWQQGYTCQQWLTDPNRYEVVSPEGRGYDVDLKSQTCGCKACRRWHTCKHLIALQAKVAAGI